LEGKRRDMVRCELGLGSLLNRPLRLCVSGPGTSVLWCSFCLGGVPIRCQKGPSARPNERRDRFSFKSGRILARSASLAPGHLPASHAGLTRLHAIVALSQKQPLADRESRMSRCHWRMSGIECALTVRCGPHPAARVIGSADHNARYVKTTRPQRAVMWLELIWMMVTDVVLDHARRLTFRYAAPG